MFRSPARVIQGPTPGLPLRRVIFWLHLACGIVAGAVILLMSVTGVLLTYEVQMTSWADRHYRSLPTSPQDQPLPIHAILEKVSEAEPTAASSVTLRHDRLAPAAVNLEGAGTVYVDVYSGAVLGRGSQRVRSFFSSVRGWHRWLNLKGDLRALGRSVTGVANLVFLFIIASGLYLWFPRRWTLKPLRSGLLLRRGARGKVRDFNWHHVFGFWTSFPLIVVVASALVISYPWASNLTYRLMGESPPVRATPAPNSINDPSPPPDPARLDVLMLPAADQLADWRSITILLPKDPATAVSFRIDQGNGRQPQKRHTIQVDPASGQVVAWQPFDSLSAGRRARSYLRFAHTGEVWGVLGQTVAGLASLAAVFLVWTGLTLSFRRLFLEPARRRRRRSGVRASPNRSDRVDSDPPSSRPEEEAGVGAG